MSPRIEPVGDPDEDQLRRLAKTPHDSSGAPLNLFSTLAHRPRLMGRVNALGGCLALDSALGDRERELAIVRAAANSGCDYELAHHRVAAAAAGIEPDEILAAESRGRAHSWSSADAALLGVVDQICDDADLDDAAWEGLEREFGPEARIDILVLAGFYRMLAGFLNGARVESD
jgi:AhpD family alkylhydroperoxidase